MSGSQGKKIDTLIALLLVATFVSLSSFFVFFNPNFKTEILYKKRKKLETYAPQNLLHNTLMYVIYQT